MTDDRQHDEIVSAAYRELNQESAPKHLDDKILRMAKSNAARPRYSRSIMWTRPLAWAATIALCLAITLEFTRVPSPEVVVPATVPVPATAGEAVAPFEAEAVAPAARKRAAESLPEAVSTEKPELRQSIARQVADEPKSSAARRDAEGLVEKDVAEEAVISPTANFAVEDADMLQRAEDMAEQQNRSNNQPQAEGFARLASSTIAVANECADDVRAEPESWLECIAALEASGDNEAATRQRENLAETFPDFKLP